MTDCPDTKTQPGDSDTACPTAAETGPVTAIVKRRARADRIDEFEVWLSELKKVGEDFPGHLDTNVIRPDDPTTQDYVIITRFECYDCLCRFEKSKERAELLKRGEALYVGDAQWSRMTGLEYWFNLRDLASQVPPKRYKQAIVTLLAVYPLAFGLFLLFGPLLNQLSPPLRALALSGTLVTLMTWIVMPFMTRLFAKWLYPPLKNSDKS